MPPTTTRQIPVWDNILLRTVLHYLILGVVFYAVRGLSVGGLGVLSGVDSFAAITSKKELLTAQSNVGPAALPTLIAMVSAFVLTLPVAWIYMLTRQKKGFSQSLVQSLIVLPVVIAGIVVLVKHSLALAFSLGGIVAAVRFRSNLDDTKDAASIFCVTGIGLAAAVEPTVALVMSFGFNALTWGLWASEFARSPVSLEGKRAQRSLDRALAVAGRTGTFVAKMDDEILKALGPEQLEALADKAWKRRRKIGTDELPAVRHEHQFLLRVRCDNLEVSRPIIEREFDGLFSKWKYMGAERGEDGKRYAEYGVDFAETVTRGVVTDTLRAAGGAGIDKVEIR